MAGEAKVFLLPSLHDDSPLAVIEARTNGLPVVCLDRGGSPLLGGRAAEVGDVDSTAHALAVLIERSYDLGKETGPDDKEFENRLKEALVGAGLMPDSA